MYIETVPNRASPPAILLRESWREGGKVHKRTLLNLTHWDPAHIDGLRAVLKGGTVIPPGQDVIRIERSLPHGHVAAVLGTARRIGLDTLLGPEGNRCRDLVLALLVSRILDPASKLATARRLSPDTASSSLGEMLGLGEVDEDELYTALDWLHERQPAIETALARRHLQGGTLVLYDVSSSYLEGRCCPLAARGYSRDGKPGKLQITYGLLCAPDGCPVAIEVFEGNTGDPATLATQVDKLKQRFRLENVVLVGDRGMITEARIGEDLRPAGLDWITALRAPAIQALVASGRLQMTLFDERNMASITSPDYPNERLIVCRNPDLAAERQRKRIELLDATARDLARIQAAVNRQRNPLRGSAEIALKVGAVLDQHKMAKHFALDIADARFHFTRKQDVIDAEAATDGLYVVRTSLETDRLDDATTVRSYKSLALVERAFRCLKSVDLQLRPVRHWLPERVRAHVFLCMLAYYLEWHLRQRLAPMLFHDTDRTAAEAQRNGPVAKAERSPAAITKQTTGVTPDGLPVHSFSSLLADLATLARNTVTTATNPHRPFTLLTRPTPIQQKAFDLLSLSL
ncbi:IS1634 family transposase [Paracraurococcus lichenis]|uniref:IS1634 family transposase n=1 Tax=Paracraurococcus lichenis TaxID=3064888 RepID=A0ABT9EDY4_9PROT|nr:IS1634 family transposase [Paracraurococcus sp. LOR1-02]MDO9714442.1 IS1634 family transposase [Paracraurococcus sp. LOR1-02]